MTGHGTVTIWLNRFKDSDDSAARELWSRYDDRIRRLAKKQLGSANRRLEDEDDAANIAFSQFCKGVQNKSFEKLEDRDDLWQVLAMITVRKSISIFRRDVRNPLGESAIVNTDDQSNNGFNNVVHDNEQTAEEATLSFEECDRLLNLLPDETTRAIAVNRLEGYEDIEISDRVGVALRTVQRKIRSIKDIWGEELAKPDEGDRQMP